jgi:hypothetical protein
MGERYNVEEPGHQTTGAKAREKRKDSRGENRRRGGGARVRRQGISETMVSSLFVTTEKQDGRAQLGDCMDYAGHGLWVRGRVLDLIIFTYAMESRISLFVRSIRTKVE